MNDAVDKARAWDAIAEKNAKIEQLRERCLAYKGQVEAGAAEIERLRIRNAALVECLSASLCPYNGQATGVTVGECQQCGCSHGLLIQPLTPHQGGGAA